VGFFVWGGGGGGFFWGGFFVVGGVGGLCGGVGGFLFLGVFGWVGWGWGGGRWFGVLFFLVGVGGPVSPFFCINPDLSVTVFFSHAVYVARFLAGLFASSGFHHPCVFEGSYSPWSSVAFVFLFPRLVGDLRFCLVEFSFAETPFATGLLFPELLQFAVLPFTFSTTQPSAFFSLERSLGSHAPG